MAAVTVLSENMWKGISGRGTTFFSTQMNRPRRKMPMIRGARTAALVQLYCDPAQERARRTRMAHARVSTEPYQSSLRSLAEMDPLTRLSGRRKMMTTMARLVSGRLI